MCFCMSKGAWGEWRLLISETRVNISKTPACGWAQVLNAFWFRLGKEPGFSYL